MNTPYLIRIDPASIKKNPHAGQTVFQQYIGTETEEVKVFYGNGWWHREVYHEGVKVSFSSVKVKPDQQVMEALPVGWHSSQSTKQLYNTIHTRRPLANYLFEYLDSQVKCRDCGAEFSWKKLEKDSRDDYDDRNESYWHTSNEICPECGEWDCCQLETEELDQATGLVEQI